MAVHARTLARLTRIEATIRLNDSRHEAAPGESACEDLGRDDPIRLAGFLNALARAQFLACPPDPDDTSQVANFVRSAWEIGLITEQAPRDPHQGR